MDRILSTRVDDAVYRRINDLAKKMRTSKKAVIEKAITLLAQRVQQDKGGNVFDETCGTWKRSESPGETVSFGRTAFNASMNRYQQ